VSQSLENANPQAKLEFVRKLSFFHYMTYSVFGGTLNPAQSQSRFVIVVRVILPILAEKVQARKHKR